MDKQMIPAPYKIALAQYTPKQGDCAYNLEKILQMIEAAKAAGASLLVLPELSYTGYWMNHHTALSLAEEADGFFVQTMRAEAKKHGMHIFAGYSELTTEENVCRARRDPDFPDHECCNTSVLIDDTGRVLGSTRKAYLWKKEKQVFVAGNHFPVFDTALGRIGLSICYDLEFPEPARILGLKGADLILNAAAWSKDGATRWEIDLRAAAMHNLLYVAGANYADDTCCGRSMVVGPFGNIKAEASFDEETLLLCEIDLRDNRKIRDAIPYWDDFRPEFFSMDAASQ